MQCVQNVSFLHDGCQVKQLGTKGRGLVNALGSDIAAGTVILREDAVIFVEVDEDAAASNPIIPTAELAIAIIKAGVVPKLDCLEPEVGVANDHGNMSKHRGFTQRASELSDGVEIVRKHCSVDSLKTVPSVKRLLLAISLNAHGIKLPSKPMLQGIFPVIAAMCNHSCRPNMMFQGRLHKTDSGDEKLEIVLRTVRRITIGEELTISYLGSQYLSFPERDERLQDIYLFGAETLSTDKGLEALALTDALQIKTETSRVVSANRSAEDAWDEALLTNRTSKKFSQLQAIALANYSIILKSNLLGKHHAWRYNAHIRVAKVLTQTRSVKACVRAVGHYEQALEMGALVWAGDLWPEARSLIHGGQQACLIAGADLKDKLDEFTARLKYIDETLRLVPH
eukprot:m.42316 g.42316  ORF g.42316 m.42316 type:complete len:397 (-) comp19069_c0_seq1:213-1403(-)